jgi:hypothetical protein
MSEPSPDAARISELHRPSPPVVREFNDRGSLWLLEDPANLRGVLQILEPDLADRLDFARAQRINRRFIPADLQKRESDLIFQVPFTGRGPGREIWVYVLLEHQSEPDPLMGLRLYLYMGQLWDSQRREWEDANVPAAERRLRPVIPLVFYTGTETWRAPIGLASLMDLPAELERFVPGWETLLLDLHETPPQTLTRFATAAGWALRVLQAEKAPLAEMERVLTEAIAGLEGLPEEQAGQWLRVAWYFALLIRHRREEPELMELLQERAEQSKFRMREEIITMGQTIAQRIEEEAKREAKREDLEMVLTERFGPIPAAIQRQLSTADVEALKTWLRVASRATRLEEVGILPPEST